MAETGETDAAGPADAPPEILLSELDVKDIGGVEGVIVAIYRAGGDDEAPQLGAAARTLDGMTAHRKRDGGQIQKALDKASGTFAETITLTAPVGVAADAIVLVNRGTQPLDFAGARAIGGAIAAAALALKAERVHVRLDGLDKRRQADWAAEAARAMRLRAYTFNRRKSAAPGKRLERIEIAGLAEPEAAAEALAPAMALAEGAEFARDLVNEPANVLTPPAFAQRVKALESDGLRIDIYGESALAKMGLTALLGVGQGSVQETHLAVMTWRGAADPAAPPLCLLGKGVCFDTGGISLKPPAGMEEMTMDMAGAAAVAGAMLALSRRRASANVIGLLGLVENMPDAAAQRPGDVVLSHAGKTIEIVNTDAEGRLVLADVISYAEATFEPRAMVDLATLTGAVIVALGHERAGLFANDDAFAETVSRAADESGEPVWRLPLGAGYDKMIRSRVADMKNSGGRAAGSITAAQFLQRFVAEGRPWAHLDIAGSAMAKEAGPMWPKGARGWGVDTLVRLAEDMFAER